MYRYRIPVSWAVWVITFFAPFLSSWQSRNCVQILCLGAGMRSHDLALPASVLCAAATLETLRRAKQRVLPFLCAFSDLLPSSTVILLKVSTKTHCHSPEPSLPCLSSPLFPPSILLSFIVVFAQKSRKSAYPTHRDVCQSHTKFKLLGKAQHYLHHQQQKCVCVQ